MKRKALIIGSSGQIGTELVAILRDKLGADQVIASDVNNPGNAASEGPFEQLDVMDADRLFGLVKKHEVTEVYLLAALLSATAEKNPMLGWKLNMEGLFNVLNLAKEKHIQQVYWPSSIAVFGPTTPRENTPQYCVMEPSTVYGISKQAGERWCEYYFNKYGVDVRSIRYPGLIGWKSAPGGGTTDYAVHIFHEALKAGKYTSFLSENTTLPMMYMPDAIRATIELMEADASKVKVRSSYNVAGFSFSPQEIAAEIKKLMPNFEIGYEPDFRQEIADSWPKSINDAKAREDWNWAPAFNLSQMTSEILTNLKNLLKTTSFK